MALFSELTPTQQNVLASDLRNTRSLVGQIARLLAQLQALDINWQAQTKNMALTLTTGTIIPDQTGLAGAGDISTDQYQQMMGLLEALMGAAWTPLNQQLFVLFCGPNNIVG